MRTLKDGMAFVIEDGDITDETAAIRTSDQIHQSLSQSGATVVLQLDLDRAARSHPVLAMVIRLVRFHRHTVTVVADRVRQANLLDAIASTLRALSVKTITDFR